ncbi:MAG: proton-conducting transporter membrane subunit [Candidatus Bathyarchaeota archaeon]|nr:proton-conducting transporter membrane subunit [Candidatus Bathyarchaeota archaeon]
MIGILEVLTPSIILISLALITVPVMGIVRRNSKGHRSLSLVWVLAVFSALTVGIARLYFEYYTQVEGQPFVTVFLVGGERAHLSSSFLVDAVSMYMAIVYLIVGLISCLYSVFYIKLESELSERYFALLFMILGSVMAATFSGDLLTLFIFWEASAAGSCFLIVYGKKPESIEACLKYLVMIIVASGFIVFGLSMIYGLVGSLSFWTVREALISLSDKRLLIVAFAFVACGYAIETAVVPFHMWLPDAYTASPSSSSAFLSAIVDQASYYVFMRVLVYILTPQVVLNWPLALAVFSAVTMTVGNLFALAQDNVKRMISYICVADIGYNLVAITSVKSLGVMGNLFFFLVGGMTTALAFMTVGIFNNLGLRELKEFSGVGRRFPMTSLALVVAVFSFSGIPPASGFVAKYMVFTAAIEAEMAWLAVVGVLNSLLQTAYLFRLVHFMYAGRTRKRGEGKEPRDLLVAVYALVALIVILGLYPSLALTVIYPAAQQLNLLVP